jgi:hypothetical protein
VFVQHPQRRRSSAGKPFRKERCSEVVQADALALGPPGKSHMKIGDLTVDGIFPRGLER